MLTVNNLVSLGAMMGSGVVTLSHTDSAVDTTDASAYTFSSRSIGTASGDRVIVVTLCARSGGSPTLSSATIGGISATIIKQNTSSGSLIAIFGAIVPTGTTATVVANLSAGAVRCAISVDAAYGASLTAADTDSTNTHPFSVGLDVPAGGVAFGGVADGSNASTTWVGLTERVDATFADDPQVYSMASLDFATAQSGLTISATLTASSGGTAVFASLGPA